MYYINRKYGERPGPEGDAILHQRLYPKMASGGLVLNLAGINACILFKEQQQQESPEESPAASDRGAEGRIHGGERGHGSRHKVASSGTNHCSSSRHGGSAGPKELQTEPSVGQNATSPCVVTVRGERR